MVQRYREYLLHIVAMILTMVQDDDVTADTPCLTSSITHLTCNCGGAEVHRVCWIEQGALLLLYSRAAAAPTTSLLPC